jgi:hypothetical protein
MLDGRAGHGQGLARGGIFGEFLAGVGRPSGRSVTGRRSLTEPEPTPSRRERKQEKLWSRYVCTAP